MVHARQAFLDAGHYQPIAERLTQHAHALQPQHWLDIGCGEGYYSAALDHALPNAQGYALDISKAAIKACCRRSQRVHWLVASMTNIPLATASCQLITSIFSPINWPEAQRLLAPSGNILHVGPATEHLIELRERLYDDVRPYDDGKHLQALPPSLHSSRQDYLRYTLTLDSAAAREQLLAMTPHGWRVNAQRRAAILEQPLSVTVAVRFDWITQG